MRCVTGNGLRPRRVGAALLLLLASALPVSAQGQRAAPADGNLSAPILTSFFSSDPRLAASLAELPSPVRAEIERRLQRRGSFRPQLPDPGTTDTRERALAAKRFDLERAILAIVARPGIEAEATQYATVHPVSYEWEGDPRGPLSEATFVAGYLARNPESALRGFLYVYGLYLYRCAFEAAHWESNDALTREGSAGYKTMWAQTQQFPDPVIPAIANDIDAEKSIYADNRAHPRTFRTP
jgi:hypothetical protein